MDKLKRRTPWLYGAMLVIALLPLSLGLDSVSSVLLAAAAAAFYVMGGYAYYVGGLVAALAGALWAYGTDIAGALIFTLGTMATALIIGKGFIKGRGFSYILILSALAQLLSVFLSLAYTAYKNNVDIYYILVTMPIEGIKNAARGTAAADLMLTPEVLRAIEELYRIRIPSVLIITCAAMAYFTFAVARAILRRLGEKDYNYPYFYELRLSRATTVIFLILFAAGLTLGGISPEFENIIVVCLIVFAVCGISVVDFFLKKHKLFGFIRFLIYMIAIPVLALTFPILSPFVIFAGLGIADSFKNLRRLGLEGTESGEQ